MIIENFNRTIDLWIKELGHYSFIQLCAKPPSNSWSLGQVYRHLIDDAKYYIKQVKICVAINDYANEQAAHDAKTMFCNNNFPDEILEGSPANTHMPQPDNKDQLLNDLLNLKSEINKVAVMISKTSFNGKTKHPGLDYFSATEWFQFADMHFRHHLRKKKRIDEFLTIVNHN
ncbi:MAG: DinB family protein [Cyclobacteriaceae bacterium]